VERLDGKKRGVLHDRSKLARECEEDALVYLILGLAGAAIEGRRSITSSYGAGAMWYKTARVFAVLLVIFFILWMSSFLYFVLSLHLGPTEDSVFITGLTAVVSLVGMIVTIIGTASTILIGWRAERRQSEESRLRIKQLELQLQAAQQTQAKATGDKGGTEPRRLPD
jgi:hypothetical protein